MFGTRLSKKQWILLTAGLATAVLCLVMCKYLAKPVKKQSYDTAVRAAEQMQRCMDAVKEEKLARGIEIVPEDRFSTGLIGEDYNFITTTSGDLAAKRTTADPNMAAVMVFMLEQAGLKSGDRLGCNFSGSFPAMNIATLCACDALGVVPVYICSCGASNWGANNPDLTFPEMATVLYDRGLVSTAPALITPGGGDDIGAGVDSDLFSQIWERVQTLPCPTMQEADYAKNIAARKALLDGEHIKCFISVGGNITSLGYNMISGVIGQGILKTKIPTLNSKSGLLEIYLHEGMPTVLILNIRQLAADHGFSFDPDTLSPVGSGSIYYKTQYPVILIFAALAAELAFLILYRKEKIANAGKTEI